VRHQRFPEVEQTSSCRTLPKEEVKGRRQFWCLPPNIFSYQKLILSAKSKSAVHTCLDHPRRVQRFQSGAPKCQSSSRAKPVHPLHMRDDCLQIGSVPHLIPSGCHSWSISAFVSFFSPWSTYLQTSPITYAITHAFQPGKLLDISYLKNNAVMQVPFGEYLWLWSMLDWPRRCIGPKLYEPHSTVSRMSISHLIHANEMVFMSRLRQIH